ncbi:hypothetical protein FA15DRAFT_693824 [Coprinopsis marcescibilis]|uniref:Glycosyltransferase 61 catalytic domain-containing protein n=1 Tax=Coprinopsis marcescibilis TaxID=230819 RepID=A0A5C3KXG6_COPMA|nr:hypothetical protein FA15DRAFT_693824 [Coprinopsis marcescibilis]
MSLRVRARRSTISLGIAFIFIAYVWFLPLYDAELLSLLQAARRTLLLNQQQELQAEETSRPLASTREETTIPSVILPGSNPPIKQSTWVLGFALMDTLYLRDGSFYVVTENPEFPSRDDLIARWLDLDSGLDRTATDKEMQIISPEMASEVLGEVATVIPGFSVILYDPPQFMHHFYHWWGEIILGMWRVYSTLVFGPGEGLGEDSGMKSLNSLSLPSRFILPAIQGKEWRDRAGVIGPLMRAAFPGALIETSDYWEDLIDLETTVVFERAMIINRYNAHRHPNNNRWFKMIAGAMSLSAPEGYWEPIRKSILRNTLGYIPFVDSQARVVESSVPDSQEDREYRNRPVVTYISRQNARRRLVEEDHLRLVESLKQLEEEGLCRLEIPAMERLNIKQQLEIGARTTIMVGVHGNGLTHQLIMPPSLRSAVFEIFDPPSYVFDYEMLARNLGHKHYGVQNDSFLTFPAQEYHEGLYYSPGFHGNSIPVYGPAIADMIRKRLTEPEDAVQS